MNRGMRWILIVLLLAAGAGSATAQEEALLVTYGPEASTAEGDDDFRQVVSIRLPASTAGELYLRLFDADCGGERDDPAADFDTTTRFSLTGAGGVSLATEEFSVDTLRDDRWYNFATFTAADGEADGDDAVFELVALGMTGDDANLWNVAVSTSDKQNRPPDALHLLTLTPSVRLPRASGRAELRFEVPASAAAITLRNFDAAGARLTLDTALREDLPVTSSGQGDWAEGTVGLEGGERGAAAAFVFSGGAEVPNDATFQVLADGEELPVELPIPIRAANHRPEPRLAPLALADCRTMVFDASLSRDEDGDVISYHWDFGDGESAGGRRVSHTYARSGSYAGELRLTDDSGQVTHGSSLELVTFVNEPPRAVAGPDQVAMPGRELTFDGSASSDSDGQVARYLWDFGDGVRTSGASVSHAFSETGLYTVTLRVEDDADVPSPCNAATDQLEVWINASPALEAGPNKIGSPGEPLTFEPARVTDPDGEITAWDWDLGDGNARQGRQVEHAYLEPGTYSVTLTVTDDGGVGYSTATSGFSVKINDPPVAEAGREHWVAVGEDVPFDAGGSIDRDGRLVAYQWSFGDGSQAAGGRVSHAYERPGRYEVQLVVRDDSTSSSDTDNDTTVVVVNKPPSAAAGEDQWVTASEVRFDGTASTDDDGRVTAYAWDFGDGKTSSEASPVHVYKHPSTYEAQLTVTDDSPTSSRFDTDALWVIVNALPIADAGADRIAAPGQELAFDGAGSVDPDGGIASFAWDFGDGATASGPAVRHAFEKPGLYTVRLTVHDTTGHENATGYDELTVRVNQAPRAVAGPTLAAAPGDEVVFDGRRSYDPDDSISSYLWELRNGSGPAGSGPAMELASSAVARHTFESPGIYTARLTVVDSSGAMNARAEDEVTIEVNHPPRAVPGDDVGGCDTTIAFDASASADPDGHPLSYRWDFGDGSPAVTGVRVAHTYPEGGSYPVVLSVDDGRGLQNSTHTAAMTVTINDPPSADPGGERSVCSGDPVLFTGAGSRDPEGGLLRYRWDFGDGETGEGLNPTKTYLKGGVCQVTLTVNDDSALEQCDTSVAQTVVRVAQSPVAVAGEDRTACTHVAVPFDGSASQDFSDGVVNAYDWDFGDGETGAGATPVHVFNEPGTYEVVLTITGDEIGDCDNTHSDEATLTVLSGPVPFFEAPPVVATDQSVDFAGSGSSGSGRQVVSYQWDFGDGATATGSAASHAWKEPGRYEVTLTVATAGESLCRSASTVSYVHANATPVAVAGEDRVVGVMDPVTLTAAGSKDADGEITAYEWDFHDGETATGFEVRHRFAESGRYDVTLDVVDSTNVSNNRTRDTVRIEVNAAPNPVLTAPEAGCVDEEVRFDASASGDADGAITAYAWDFGDGASSEGASAGHAYAAPGVYQLSLTADDGRGVSNSRATVTQALTVNRLPVPHPGPARTVCAGEDVAFDGSLSADVDGEITAYAWDFGDGGSADGAQVSHAYTATGTYEVTLAVTDDSSASCRTQRATVPVRVNTSPVAVAGGDRQTFVGGAHDALVFDATSSSDADGDPLTYSWDFGDGTNAVGARVRHVFTRAGTYTVTLKVDDGAGTGCSVSSAEVTVEVRNRG